MKYACVARHRGEHSVRLMCRVLEVSATGYYAWRKRGPCARAIADERLMLNIRIAHRESDETYGAPRVHEELRDAGPARGEEARCAPHASPRPRGPSPDALDADHGLGPCPSRCPECARPAIRREWHPGDESRVGGGHHLRPHRGGCLFLAVVLDLASRRVVGWAMRTRSSAELALAALRMALAARRPEPGLVHHSDRGVQYACTEYQTLLATHGLEAEHEPQGELLGQCRGGELLRHP